MCSYYFRTIGFLAGGAAGSGLAAHSAGWMSGLAAGVPTFGAAFPSCDALSGTAAFSLALSSAANFLKMPLSFGTSTMWCSFTARRNLSSSCEPEVRAGQVGLIESASARVPWNPAVPAGAVTLSESTSASRS
jgi:hypothetical protein